MQEHEDIVVRGAREHNLQGIDVTLPRGKLTVVTGVSGSGKSSLAFDTLFREGQRRFLETLPSYARSFVRGLNRPAVTSIDGLGPAIAIGQRVALSNPRSTVGTLTEVWDLLRLLFARRGAAPADVKLSRGLFSFNGAEGACPRCQGLGVEDRLDPDLIVDDPSRSLRDGALRVSTPNGYLMYSQVTLKVLDDVLRAHGGSVDVPWRELSEEARGVVWHGSERLKVPYGKHPLESRMRWTGITARPRQEGFYRGLLPVMEEILRGKRNDSILRFVRSTPCSACGGTRLRPEARSVTWQDKRIYELAALSARELQAFLAAVQSEPVLSPIRNDVCARCDLMVELGLGYLTFDRAAPTLSLGEAQRLRLLSLALGELRGLLAVLDEPSAGLHPDDVRRLIGVLRRLCDQGQTVVVVEHDPLIARAADWLIDLGPGPAREGGKLLHSGPPEALLQGGASTPTRDWLASPPTSRPARADHGTLRLEHLTRNNVHDAGFVLKREALNVVTGVSGAGKTSLLGAAVEQLQRTQDAFRRIVTVDAEPIGRTPRSNAATYSGAFDVIRDRFAATPEARAAGLTKSHFSFNAPGGRCEKCEGAGVIQVGMRYLGSVDLVCDSCEGQRFLPAVLAVRYQDLSIADVLEGSIASAALLFSGEKKLKRILETLLDLGLGYLSLGQPATTLSGGEAQRIKLATELSKLGATAALIALDEPTTGLHGQDVQTLLRAWQRWAHDGHTLLVVDHDLDVVRVADQVIDVGPGSGPQGGRVVFQGTPEELARCEHSLTGAALRVQTEPRSVSERATEWPSPGKRSPEQPPSMHLRAVRTHNLQGFDVAIPARGLTVITGPSGCGKSSLVFDTLLAESQNRFSDMVAPWARRLLPRRGGAELEAAVNLQAAVAVAQRTGRRNPRSTVGTVSELDELLRMLYSRTGTRPCPSCGAVVQRSPCECGQRLEPLWSGAFSPNTEAGACPACKGLGFVQRCDPGRLVARPERALDAGAMEGTRFGEYLGEPDGQHMATLRAAAHAEGVSVDGPFLELGERARELSLHGTGERVYDVVWRYKRGQREGEHRFQGPWKGLLKLVEDEYERVHADPKGEPIESLMCDVVCGECGGARLGPGPRSVTFAGRSLPEAERMSLDALQDWLGVAVGEHASGELVHRVGEDLLRRVRALCEAGLGYVSLEREMASLSGGEAQRLRLASALGGGLVGVTYVLDEPTQGLHARDTEKLAGVLRSLADAGNAVVVVEHDKALVSRADRVIEVGPGAGPAGGRLMAQGACGELPRDSYTAQLLRRRPVLRDTPTMPFRPGVSLSGASVYNLKGLDVTFPIGALVAVTGVSGSGKSTLVLEVLAPSIAAKAPRGCSNVEFHVALSGVESMQQDSLASSGASTVASLTGMSERLRKRFAATAQAKAARLSAKHFSTAAPGGRCEACDGRGVVTVAMDLLPDVTVGCDACEGRRFQPQVLACLLDGRSITDVLEASVADAAQWFAADASLSGPLQELCALGLGYLQVGQEAATLSSGELQRLRLATLLHAPGAQASALLLDEPTRGLGFEDVNRLIAALRRLAGAGHLVVAIEHDLELIASADWVIELGPEGGDGGGRLVAQGTPRETAAVEDSPTGQALRE